MLYLAGVRLRYFAALALPGSVLLYQAVMTAAYRRDRIEAFLNPWSDARGAGYQIIQSLIAVGTGGLTGVGLMEGRQKLFYLPYPYSDFIFAVIGEELGLLGALGGGARLRAPALARACARPGTPPTPSGCSWPPGLTLSIVIQAFINISVVLGLRAHQGHPPALHQRGRDRRSSSPSSRVGLVLNVSQHAD